MKTVISERQQGDLGTQKGLGRLVIISAPTADSV